MPIAHIFWPRSPYEAQASISCYFIGEHNCALAYPAALPGLYGGTFIPYLLSGHEMALVDEF